MRTSPPPEADAKAVPAALRHRLFAMLYDALLVTALLMAITALLMAATGPEGLYPTPWWYPPLLIAAWYLFVAWCWRRGGATLGMQAWRLRVETLDGQRPGWRATALRFVGAILSGACLGLGYLWVWIDRDRRTWHDRLSGTRVVRLTAPGAKPAWTGSSRARQADHRE